LHVIRHVDTLAADPAAGGAIRQLEERIDKVEQRIDGWSSSRKDP